MARWLQRRSDARDELLPDLMARAPRDPDHWWDSLARTHVTVVGASRLGSILACSLSSAGVGRVTVEDSRPVTLAMSHGEAFTGPMSVTDELLTCWRTTQSCKRSVPRPNDCHDFYVLTDAVDLDARRPSADQPGRHVSRGKLSRARWAGLVLLSCRVVPRACSASTCIVATMTRRGLSSGASSRGTPRLWRTR